MQTISTEIQVSPDVAAILRSHAQAQRNGDEDSLPSQAQNYQWVPQSNTLTYALASRAWKPYVGGLDFAVAMPWNGAHRGERALAAFTDPNASRTVREYENTLRRGPLYLQFIDGRWFAYMRWRPLKAPKKPRRYRERGPNGRMLPLKTTLKNAEARRKSFAMSPRALRKQADLARNTGGS